jgi:hypothetical protein
LSPDWRWRFVKKSVRVGNSQGRNQRHGNSNHHPQNRRNAPLMNGLMLVAGTVFDWMLARHLSAPAPT